MYKGEYYIVLRMTNQGGSHEYSSCRNRLCGTFFSHPSFSAQLCNVGGYYFKKGGYDKLTKLTIQNENIKRYLMDKAWTTTMNADFVIIAIFMNAGSYREFIIAN